MKKLLLLIGLVVFLTPNVYGGSEKDINNFHCLKEIKQKLEVKDEYSGTWENKTKQCQITNRREYQSLATSPLIIINNKCKFNGTNTKCRNKLGNKLKIKAVKSGWGIKYPNFKGKLDGNNLVLKTNDSNFKNCNFEFVKNNEVKKENENSISNISKEYCFCIDQRKKVFSIARYNGIPNYCSDNSYYSAKAISYGMFLKNKGKPIIGNLKSSEVSFNFLTNNKEIDKWLKETKVAKDQADMDNRINNIVEMLIEILDIDEDIARLLVTNGYISLDYIPTYEAMLSLGNLEKIEGLDNDLSIKIITNAKNFIKEQQKKQEKILIAQEKFLGRKLNYNERVCGVIGFHESRIRAEELNFRPIENRPRGLRIIDRCHKELERIEWIARQRDSSNEPTEQQKQQALAQENATGQATWKSTAGGIWYWDYGNGFGWAPPNPIRDRIIQGLSVSQRTKNMLMTGPKGKTIFIPR